MALPHHHARRRLWGCVAAATTSAIAIGGVAASAAVASGSARPAASGGTLNVMGFGTNGDDIAKSRFALAAKAVAPMRISAPNGGFSDQAFLADIAGGNVPDLVYMSSYQVGTYAAKGVLMPFSSCIKSQHINMNTFTPGARQMATLNGTVYGLPEFTDDRTLMVNESVIHKAGLADADISTTNWSKLSQLATKLTSTSNGKLQTIGFDPKLPEFFPIWAAANGGAILSSNGLTAELNSRQNVAALNYAVSLIKAQGGYSNFITYRNTLNYFGNNNPFAESQIGITPFENWMFNVVASTSPDVTVHAVPFTDRKGNVIDYETGSVWVIPKAAKNPQAACVFAKTMTEASTWMAAAQNRIKLYKKQGYYFSGLLTGNHVADRNILLYAEKNASTNNPWDQAMLVTYAVEAHSFTVPNSPASEAVQNDWTQAVNSVLQGQASAKAALDQAQSQAQASINSAKGSA